MWCDLVKVIVFVTPKRSVLDPQGKALQHAMRFLGYQTAEVRVGKTIAFEIEGRDTSAFRAYLDTLCHQLLSNPIIEDYRYEIITSSSDKESDHSV